jgi:hypothetical protein
MFCCPFSLSNEAGHWNHQGEEKTQQVGCPWTLKVVFYLTEGSICVVRPGFVSENCGTEPSRGRKGKCLSRPIAVPPLLRFCCDTSLIIELSSLLSQRQLAAAPVSHLDFNHKNEEQR